ncbi:hypothetical protein [Deinococcus hopiensis]|uniref:Uncharacterized protein n=1 Tax=Deinococcus hopiensis KR-140 TaxID=695939 RepID=A0A1W1V604_9DEIO|nr:hypothetical protein [Deinococcus hopiensis]SMB88610.1 hypothetical protein SAMN00790413_00113 [Deinococcus hopiensis KR-140]
MLAGTGQGTEGRRYGGVTALGKQALGHRSAVLGVGAALELIRVWASCSPPTPWKTA